MIGQGSELWLEHPGTGHDLILDLDVGVMTGPEGEAASQRLVVGARNKGIAQVAVEQGGAMGFHIPAALIAEPGPIRLLFVHPDFRRPMDIGGGTDDRQLSFSVRSLRLFRVHAAPGTASPAARRCPLEQMIHAFESLGDKCEFGHEQRQQGAEPLGLLRFSNVELPLLVRGQRNRLRRTRRAECPSTSTSKGRKREFVVREVRLYGMTYHTFPV